MDETYSFKNKEQPTITKKADTLLWNHVQNFEAKGQAVLVLALREHDNL